MFMRLVLATNSSDWPAAVFLVTSKIWGTLLFYFFVSASINVYAE